MDDHRSSWAPPDPGDRAPTASTDRDLPPPDWSTVRPGEVWGTDRTDVELPETSPWSPPPVGPHRRAPIGRLPVAVGIAAVVLLLVGVGTVLSVLIARSVEDATSTAGRDTDPEPAPAPSTGLPPGVTDPAPEFPPTGDPAVDALTVVLSRIDESERRMIGYQVVWGQAQLDPETGELREGDTSEATLAAIRSAATAALDALHGLDARLGDVVIPDGEDGARVAAIRDAYARHLEAWLTHLAAVRDDPASYVNGVTDPAAFEDINVTGERFADAVADGLPEGTPAELADFAAFIVERGFSQEAPEGQVA